MPRSRSPDRDKAFELWKQSNGKMLLKDIAAELGLSDTQIRKWKNIDKWDESIKSNVTKPKGNVTNELDKKRKGGAPIGNKNAVGNSGGAPLGNKNAIGNDGGAPRQNSNAVTHGFFRRIFPQDEETLAIIEEIDVKGPLDIIWENIVIQYTAIARAQKLMFVRDQGDMTKEIRKTKKMLTGDMQMEEEEYEIQFAWDKHATYLNAQARAMSELRSLIKDYLSLSSEDDKRRLELVKMQQSMDIERKKLEIAEKKLDLEIYKAIPPDDSDAETESDSFEDAWGGKVEEVWSDYDPSKES